MHDRCYYMYGAATNIASKPHQEWHLLYKHTHVPEVERVVPLPDPAAAAEADPVVP